MVAGKWPRGRAHHRPSSLLYTPGRGQVGLIRQPRGGPIRGRGGELHRGDLYRGRGERGGHPSTTIYTEALRSIVSVG